LSICLFPDGDRLPSMQATRAPPKDVPSVAGRTGRSRMAQQDQGLERNAIGLTAVLFTAFSMGELARHLPSAGGMYTYVGRGLGSFAGWVLAWTFLLASIVVPSVLFAAFGFFGASLITELTGYEQEYLWVPLTLICAGIVWWLTYRGISISTRVGVAL